MKQYSEIHRIQRFGRYHIPLLRGNRSCFDMGLGARKSEEISWMKLQDFIRLSSTFFLGSRTASCYIHFWNVTRKYLLKVGKLTKLELPSDRLLLNSKELCSSVLHIFTGCTTTSSTYLQASDRLRNAFHDFVINFDFPVRFSVWTQYISACFDRIISHPKTLV